MTTKSHIFSSELLSRVAQKASMLMLGLAKETPPSCEGANIATQLHLIKGALESQPVPPEEVQALCYLVLQDLFNICTWPPSSSSHHDPKQASPQCLYNILGQKVHARAKMIDSIKKFLAQKQSIIKPYQQRLENLSTKLNQTDHNGADQITIPDQYLNPRDKDVYPDHVNRYLVDALKKHSTCLRSQGRVDTGMTARDQWHHTRISLSNGVLADKGFAQVEIMIAAEGLAFWQEISLYVSLQLEDNGDCSNHDFSSDSLNSDDKTDQLIQMRQGDVCEMLEENSYSRIRLQLDKSCRLHKYSNPEPCCLTLPGSGESLSYILNNGNLSVEHKITLAYAIARACWQFYNSSLMHARWTSDNIRFIPIDCQPGDQISLRAFVSIPFDQHNPSLQEFLENGNYTHRYPRILCLGIILLEIALGEPLGLESFELSNHCQMNRAHSRTQMRLKEFKKIPCDHFSHKDKFVEAIDNCLNSRNFNMRESPSKRPRRDLPGSERPPAADTPVPKGRRVALYEKVVAPLFWLAKVGFEASGEIPVITVQRPVVEDEKFPTFDSAVQPSTWMDRLRAISGYVLRRRTYAKVTKPIRVAILDTGCNRDIPFFQNTIISSCFKEWKDFAANSQNPVDTFGHGTFMAYLLLQVAPIVDLYVARVAVTQDQLESNEDKIVQAIKYAGLTWEVDVISMSFSFPKSSTAISDAIESVSKRREQSIIFLASAGNSSSDRGEAFPAHDPCVISIYATDYQGTFLKSNPTRSGDGPRVLGTYGDNVPNSTLNEMKRFFPNGVFSPGTSVATAVAAGIVATMLSYSAALPVLVQMKILADNLEELKKAKGIASLLRVMSQNTDHRGDFVNPIRFWSDKSKDKDVFVAICKAL